VEIRELNIANPLRRGDAGDAPGGERRGDDRGGQRHASHGDEARYGEEADRAAGREAGDVERVDRHRDAERDGGGRGSADQRDEPTLHDREDDEAARGEAEEADDAEIPELALDIGPEADGEAEEIADAADRRDDEEDDRKVAVEEEDAFDLVRPRARLDALGGERGGDGGDILDAPRIEAEPGIEPSVGAGGLAERRRRAETPVAEILDRQQRRQRREEAVARESGDRRDRGDAEPPLRALALPVDGADRAAEHGVAGDDAELLRRRLAQHDRVDVAIGGEPDEQRIARRRRDQLRRDHLAGDAVVALEIERRRDRARARHEKGDLLPRPPALEPRGVKAAIADIEYLARARILDEIVAQRRDDALLQPEQHDERRQHRGERGGEAEEEPPVVERVAQREAGDERDHAASAKTERAVVPSAAGARVRGAKLARSSGSCVATTSAAPAARVSATSNAAISAPSAGWTEAVGSSARTICGRCASARAIATRWRCPTESCAGRLPSCAAMPSRDASVST
jgi:hypothetical protein